METLGKELERLGETRKVETLRIYYVAVLKGLDRGGAVTIAWDEQTTIEWLGMLRLPPYERLYVVHPADFVCPCPAGIAPVRERRGDWSYLGQGTTFTERIFPGGVRLRCAGCEARWLVLDEPLQVRGEGATIRPPG